MKKAMVAAKARREILDMVGISLDVKRSQGAAGAQGA
jgi:hypothetical protein